VVENLLYLFVYIKDPTPTLVVWRWSVCVALHVGCTMIAARGIVAVWHDTITKGAQPSIAHATRWLIVAMVVHGAYNGVVIFLKLSEYEF
jgi:RsiW-degrading membrane proteinase PrsW (M82 family)